MDKVLRAAGWLVLFMVVGGLSGRLCGFVILFVGNYTGNSGTTGLEYYGYHNSNFEWWWAGWTGQPIGVICGPIAGFLSLGSHTNLFKTWAVTMLGTLISGCIGALAGPFVGLLFGCLGFVGGCMMLAALKKGAETS
jgi:hypothetical protein